MATPFDVKIVTPERILFSGEAEEVSLRTTDGEIAFLAHHEDFIGALDITVVRVTTSDASASAPAGPGASGSEGVGELRLAVAGGFVHVDQDANSVTILAGVAELASEIDVARANRALESAEAAASDRSTPDAPVGDEVGGAEPSPAAVILLDPESPEAAVKRARVRLEAAGATPTA
jgi:F-type H+-transporting ATPase subunit epsilon